MDAGSTQVVESLHPHEVALLSALGDAGEASDTELVARSGLSEQQVRSALERLRHKSLVELRDVELGRGLSITALGRAALEQGLPERHVLDRVAAEPGITVQGLRDALDLSMEEVQQAVRLLKANQALEIGPGGRLLTAPYFPDAGLSALERGLRTLLAGGELNADELDPDALAQVERRVHRRSPEKGLVRVRPLVERTVVLTDAGREARGLVADRGVEVAQVTPDDLKTGAWRQRRYRPYNIQLRPTRVVGGRTHPYAQFLDWTRRKLISLGFREMTGNLVQPEFWNMDALFMPQFHSAREIHDVYFVRQPHAPAIASSEEDLRPFLERVAEVHRSGDDLGSRGWGYEFDVERSRRLVYRSQGTALSSRLLASGPHVPGRYFSLARCFRYEAIDPTHGTEFFQVEGVVLGEDISFRDLIGLLEMFALEIAHSEQVTCLPDYYPFTEPSVEVQMVHPTLGTVELGGAGIFRPEVTRPLGIDVPVIAWGLGLERMAMVALGIDDLRDLFSTDLSFIRSLPHWLGD